MGPKQVQLGILRHPNVFFFILLIFWTDITTTRKAEKVEKLKFLPLWHSFYRKNRLFNCSKSEKRYNGHQQWPHRVYQDKIKPKKQNLIFHHFPLKGVDTPKMLFSIGCLRMPLFGSCKYSKMKLHCYSILFQMPVQLK